MPARVLLTRRAPLALSETAWRRLGQMAQTQGLTRDEAATFLLENLDLLAEDALPHRLARFRDGLKPKGEA